MFVTILILILILVFAASFIGKTAPIKGSLTNIITKFLYDQYHKLTFTYLFLIVISCWVIFACIFGTSKHFIKNTATSSNAIEANEPMGVWNGMYFSAITLTTLGYGDYRPNGMVGKTLAAIEAVLGILFFSTLIAKLAHEPSLKLRVMEQKYTGTWCFMTFKMPYDNDNGELNNEITKSINNVIQKLSNINNYSEAFFSHASIYTDSNDMALKLSGYDWDCDENNGINPRGTEYTAYFNRVTHVDELEFNYRLSPDVQQDDKEFHLGEMLFRYSIFDDKPTNIIGVISELCDKDNEYYTFGVKVDFDKYKYKYKLDDEALTELKDYAFDQFQLEVTNKREVTN